MKKIFSFKFIIIFSMLMLMGLFFFAKSTYPSLIGIENCKIVRLQGDTITLLVAAQIYNSTIFGANLEEISSKISIGNEVIGTSSLRRPTRVLAKDSTLISFESKVSLKTLSRLFPQLMKKQNVNIQVEGLFFIQALWGIPAKTSDELPFRKELAKIVQETLNEETFKIKRVWPAKISAFKTDFMLQVSFKNKQPIALTLVDVDLDLYLNDNKEAFGHLILEKVIQLEPKGEQTIEGKVEVKNLKAVRQLLMSMFSKKEIKIKGYGVVKISTYEFKIPIEQIVEMSTDLF